jgi:hypothetical protein
MEVIGWLGRIAGQGVVRQYFYEGGRFIMGSVLDKKTRD